MQSVDNPGGKSKIAQLRSASNEHYTPLEVLDVVRSTWGNQPIQLDPASCALANRELVHAERYYSLEPHERLIPGVGIHANGLSHTWRARRVFVNPPGGYVPGTRRSHAQAFWIKACDEFLCGNATEIFFLGFTLEILRLSQVRPAGGAALSALRFPFCVPRERLCFFVETDWANEPIHPDPAVYQFPKLAPQNDPTHANALILLTRNWTTARRFQVSAAALGDVILPHAWGASP